MRRVIRRQTTTIKIVSVKLTWDDEVEAADSEPADPIVMLPEGGELPEDDDYPGENETPEGGDISELMSRPAMDLSPGIDVEREERPEDEA